MRRAALLGVKLFHELLPHLEPGVPETTVAALLEHNARSHGAQGMSFETIVAGGSRSALPHGRAPSPRLPRTGFLTIDFGVDFRYITSTCRASTEPPTVFIIHCKLTSEQMFPNFS